MSVFDIAFRVVIGEEGDYANNPRDPGGETKFGISKRAYPALDIAALTCDEAKAIYRRDYWDVVRGDSLPPGLALLTFDAAVNSGPSRAVRWLQAACGASVDGIMGPETLAAAGKASLAALAEFQAQRLLFMAGLPTWPTFGLGWSRRVCRVLLAAIALARPPEPEESPKPELTLAGIEAVVRKVLLERESA